jgi:hypothetical protein
MICITKLGRAPVMLQGVPDPKKRRTKKARSSRI